MYGEPKMNKQRNKSSIKDFENLFRINQNQIDVIAKLLTVCFIDDPLTRLQIKNIKEPDVFLTKLFRGQLGVYSETRDVYTLDETFKSLIIGCERIRLNWLREIILCIKASNNLKKQIEKSVFKEYVNNLKVAAKALELNWYKPFKFKNFYHINIIAIDKTDRGKGKFRSLLTPIINYCERNNLPIILETANSQNIPLFQHSGFQLVKTLENKQLGVSQYCFIKYPESVTK